MIDPHELSRPGVPSVHFAEAVDLDAMRSTLLTLHVADAAASSNHGDFLAGIGGALDLPDYYGGNWDALDECLRDLPPGRAVVLVVRGAEALWRRAPRDAAMLLELWQRIAADAPGEVRHLVYVW
jgi:RNAse (barnase) inhibitor barstar